MKNVYPLHAWRYFTLLFLLCTSVLSHAQNVPCEGVIAQTNTTGGLCIGCYTEHPELAADNNTSTYSTLHVVLGLLGSYAEQKLRFPSVSQPGDSIKILITYPVGLLDLSLLGSIQVASYNGTTYNNDRQSINTGLIQLRLISSTQTMLSWAPQQLFDQVEIRLNSGILQALNSISINYANRVVPGPRIKDSLVKVCRGKTAVIGTDSLPGVSYSWYKQPVGGFSFYSGATYTTRPVLADSTYYVEAVRNGCANPQRSVVKISSLQLPAVPVITPDSLGICRNESAIFTTVMQSGIMHRWYSQSAGGTILTAGDTFVSPLLTNPKNYYAASVDTNGCVSASRTQASVVILPPGPGVSMGSRTTMGGTGGDEFVAVLNTPDGGYLTVGNSASNDGDLAGQNHGAKDFWVVKLDGNNNKLWSKAIGTNGRDSVTGVVAAKEGKYIISGVYNVQSPSASGQLVCIDQSGNVVWTKQIPARNPAVALFPKDSNVVVAGTVGGALQLMMVDAMGTIRKTLTYNGNYAIDRISIASTADKSLLVTGTTISGGVYGRDIFVDKVDSNLNRQWEKVFLGAGEEAGVSIYRTGADHFMVNGVTLADTTSGTTVKILRMNADGVLDYIKVLGPLTPPLTSSVKGAAGNSLTAVTGSSKVAVAGKVTCPSVCRMYCPSGFVRDVNGCELCQCNSFGKDMIKLENGARPWTADKDMLLGLNVSKGPGVPNDILYLMKLDSIGNIVALQIDSTNAIIPTAITNSANGGALMLGVSGDSVSKAAIVKIDPPSCLPLTPPVLPTAASLVHDQKLMAYKELAQGTEDQMSTLQLEVFPNPFSETVTCRYAVLHTGRVVLRLTHSDGRRDVVLKDELSAPGTYNVRVNTGGYPSGIYILSLKQGKIKQIVKLLRL
ncbi:MAG TPA: hypothetical protein VM802_11990 [Chitinophaga sp.]|uniref:Ig-like domain-containing protein n=1 Tax=Chitinophaga sp. TaxID=1869181 RepID=UPI002C1E666D|nr:hypothetical protein [Chitinophaga sp.]HVI45589.1 hypothetical protein [Chitinophaga sp.]